MKLSSNMPFVTYNLKINISVVRFTNQLYLASYLSTVLCTFCLCFLAPATLFISPCYFSYFLGPKLLITRQTQALITHLLEHTKIEQTLTLSFGFSAKNEQLKEITHLLEYATRKQLGASELYVYTANERDSVTDNVACQEIYKSPAGLARRA